MQANELWAGHDYAQFPSRGRGEQFRWTGVNRVRIIKVYKKMNGFERATTYAEVYMLEHDGSDKPNPYNAALKYINYTVRARDIVCFWDEYEAELTDKTREREEKQQKQLAMLAQAGQAKKEIKELLLLAGLPEDAIVYIDDSAVRLRIEPLKEWLNYHSEGKW